MNEPNLPFQKYEQQLEQNAAEHKQALRDHRQHLVNVVREGQVDLYRTILNLSVGALALSLAFLTDYISTTIESPKLLYFAWGGWILSLFSVLASNGTSIWANSQAITLLDQQDDPNKVITWWPNKLTKWLNFFAGIFFVGGTTLMFIFAVINVR